MSREGAENVQANAGLRHSRPSLFIHRLNQSSILFRYWKPDPGNAVSLYRNVIPEHPHDPPNETVRPHEVAEAKLSVPKAWQRIIHGGGTDWEDFITLFMNYWSADVNQRMPNLDGLVRR